MRYISPFILLLFAACGQKNFEGEIKMLDSLRKEVVEVRENFNTLDSVKIAGISNEITAKTNELKKVYMPDSVNIPISTTVNQFNACRNFKATFNLQRLRIKKEIPYTLNQIEHLVIDLKNNSLKTEDAEKYIGIEKKAAIQLCEMFGSLKLKSSQKLAEFDSLKLVMDTYIDSLRSDSVNVQAIRLKLLKTRTKRQ
jgi:hypothetical protein